MPSTTWNSTVIDGVEYLVIDTAKFRVPLDWDASSQMFIAVAAPTGGLGNFPALVKGDTGDVPTLDSIDFTVLEAGDPTPDSATWTETAPGIYTLNLALHKGPQGDTGDTVLTPSDFGTPVYKKIPRVNAALDNFELQTQLVGERFVAASFSNAPSGNPNWTLGSVAVPAQDFDWRPHCYGACLVTRTNHDARVDLIARLNDETGGNIVGRGFGRTTTGYESLGQIVNLVSGPPAGASTNYDRVTAGYAATVYFRAERQAGTSTFTTSADTTHFGVRVCPVL